jgi:phenylpropionate dioxygenase-like ring-hydroxylating dioxygenase large terminal subunit
MVRIHSFIVAILPILSRALVSPFFRQWHCIGIKDNIDFSKPHITNIGELPLIVWKTNSTNYSTTINICKHMGSRLDKSEITLNGCLKCPYHGLEYVPSDTFGKTMEFQGKIFWSFDPKYPTPYKIPYFDNPTYVHSEIQVDMLCSLQDSAMNTMDVFHPAYVHNNLFGFGSNIPPQNIQTHLFKSDPDLIGLSFDYASRSIAVNFDHVGSLLSRSQKRKYKLTDNFNMFRYPTFGWSRVTIPENNNNLVIGVHFQPLEPKKTRWYVTVLHNYYTNTIQQQIVKGMAASILSQDFFQMIKQYEENALKKELMFKHRLEKEDVVVRMNKWFQTNYEYPDIKQCVELYRSKPGAVENIKKP